MGKNEYTCEICGSPTDRKMYRMVEGVKMLVCPRCTEYGEELPERHSRSRSSGSSYQRKVPYYGDPAQSTRKPAQSYRDRSYPSSKSDSHPKVKKGSIETIELKSDYRKIIRKLRQGKNMSQSEFANAVGISEATYRSIENKKMDLTIKDAQKIEKKYNVKLTTEIAGEEDFDYDISSKKSEGYTMGDIFFKRNK